MKFKFMVPTIVLLLIAIASGFSVIYKRAPISLVILQGKLNEAPLELDEENAYKVIEEVKAELGTIFGYDPG